jgi:SAM-dependent methyltransferase
MRKVNVGCGPYHQEGYINIDVNPRHSPDICRDVRKGLPFDDDSVDEILASHFLEHLDAVAMIEFIVESYRVLKGGGKLRIVVPLEEPYSLDHVQQFAEWSFDPLVFEETADYYQGTFRWKMADKIRRPPEPGGVAPFDSLHFSLVAVK